MKTSALFSAVLGLILFQSPVQADLSSVTLANWASFSLDVDGDGVADFAGSTSDKQNVALTSYTDGGISTHNLPGARPGQGSYGTAWQFTTIAALKADSIFAGDVSLVTPLFGDLHLGEGNPTVFNINSAEPIWAGWRFGTAGSGNDPFTIIGAVLDAREFFESDGAAPIKLYTHLYGSIGLGDPPMSVSLATALIIPKLASTTNFTGPKTGTITVPSLVGKTYRLHRSTSLGSPGAVIDTKAGTGSPLIFNFDESASSLAKGFFYVSES